MSKIDSTVEYKGQLMTESEYYYGVPPSHWDGMLYWDAVEDRHQRARKIYLDMIAKDFADITRKKSYEESVREFKVAKAVADTKRLLDERNNLA